MKTKKYWILVAVVTCVSVFLSTNAQGISIEDKSQVDVYGISTLHGLKTVVPSLTVSSRTLEDSAKSFILGQRDEFDAACFGMQNHLQRELEELLHKAGIGTLTSKNSKKSIDWNERLASLSINVTVRKFATDTPIYAFSVHIELSQLVQLVRNPKIRTRTCTWPNSVLHPRILFVVGFNKLHGAIRTEVTSQVNKFINDYLAANPKEPEKKQGKNSIYD